MRVLSSILAIVFFISYLALIFGSAAELTIKSRHEDAIERRAQASREITADQVKDLPIKDVREHLTWRGEPCHECEKLEHYRQALTDHIVAGTEVSPKQYSETSAQLRGLRSRQGLGDNPHGNLPHNPMEQFEARRRRHADKDDPKSGLKNVLGAHGFAVKDHPFTHDHAGQKEVHNFLAAHKERARNHDPGRRDPAFQRAEQARMEREATLASEKNRDL